MLGTSALEAQIAVELDGYDGQRLNSLNSLNPDPNKKPERRKPRLSPAALYGVAGDAVRIIAPHTEASEAALLIQLLVVFGNLIGRSAYFKIGSTYHHTRLFAVLVGASSVARKGTSWSEIASLAARVDDSFRDTTVSGLSSGEGLIHHVRDPQYKATPIREKGRIVEYQDEMVDGGAKEKRAMVVEPEFARVLKVSSREGSTISMVVREAWDSERLGVMTKSAVKASDCHVSMIGHITDFELLRTLNDTDMANGFANRFLWVLTERSKYLPSGGNLQPADLNDAVNRLRRAAEHSKCVGELKRDAAADDLWQRVYKPLSDGIGGLAGSITSRSTAQVMRLALIYALLDMSNEIRIEHMRAALSLWSYVEDSVRHIFGSSLGDKTADAILTFLEDNAAGLTKTEISGLLGRHSKADELNAALRRLEELDRIESVREATAGAPRTIYRMREIHAGQGISEISEISTEVEHLNSLNSQNASVEPGEMDLCRKCKAELKSNRAGYYCPAGCE